MRPLYAQLVIALTLGCATTAPSPVATGCDRVAALVDASDHKLAVDALAEIEATCSDAVVDAVARSQKTFDEADAHVHRAQRQRRDGDLAGASASYRAALRSYPRYYWVQKLQRDLGQEISAELAVLKTRAASQLADGDVAAAEGTLAAAVALDPADVRLEKELDSVRGKVAEAHLALARQAETGGQLEQAGRHTRKATQSAPESGSLRERIVEYARLLGLKLFSDGQLTLARDLWQDALALDMSNSALRQHLEAVQERLESLSRIKKDG